MQVWHKLQQKSFCLYIPWKLTIKGTVFIKNRHFFIQEKFNKLMYGINTVIKCGIWQPVKFQLVSRFWTGSIMKWFFYRIFELMLAIKMKSSNPFSAKQNCSRWILIFWSCLSEKISLVIWHELYFVSIQFKWNAKSYFLWKIQQQKIKILFAAVMISDKCFNPL